jgi:hypothetical protein
MIYIEVTLSEFRTQWARSDRKDSFSYKGLEVLYKYINEESSEFESDRELDIIAIDSEYSEESLEELYNHYADLETDIDDLESSRELIIESARKNHMVLEVDENTFIVGG